ncbi:UDP-2,4-diacetamido-2,4,6-trideoxy-beta-L-altropyranose hydrolase [Lederbergia citri]|uniref:UDP-2,4-diacetamido-2,4, 6-trideoxy-beta-L-altropyranose hydrolase n=1 Tax=Lederbergia citri TaxID=2833580 RepID=A0A942TFZ2_9BACI|nr:UDP-2,4-diacetamido-2,4,6-trideoxy-beta-L-altropyranose hydrolase [Lederbergia citri]MBS4195487.1 UDP-2,4-diacetamido-2,4,6-trideoxy-beta-L-altropyranose hydrolase [Lederbergia citri]
MNILIRTDASVEIGTGHVMRCLTVAQEMHKYGHQVTFVMRNLYGHLANLVKQHGFSVKMIHYIGDFKLEEDVRETKGFLLKKMYDICVVDHYSIDIDWEEEIRPYVKKIIAIDDLANRHHDCDLLLDQNMVRNYLKRYDELIPKHCEKLLGPRYLVLREEFIKVRQMAKPKNGQISRLLVFMGGSDPTGETEKVLRAIDEFDTSFPQIDVVVGAANPNKEFIRTFCKKLELSYHCQINYLATLMSKADFSIGAGGSTSWERCYLGLPSSSTIVANNQIEATEEASRLGLLFNLGNHKNVTIETYKFLLMNLEHMEQELQSMSRLGLSFTESPEGPSSWVERMLEMW